MTKQEFINKYKLQPGKGMGNALFDRSEEMVKDLDSLDNWIPVSERLPEVFRERVIHAIKVWELENKRAYTRAKIEKVLALLPDSFWELSAPQVEKEKK